MEFENIDPLDLEKILDEFSDELIIELQLKNPKGLRDICTLLSLDYQVGIEELEKKKN